MDLAYIIWMNNAKDGSKNSSILLLCLEDKSIIKIIENKINGFPNVVLLPLIKITKEILNQENNLIAYSVKEFSLGHLQVFANNKNMQILSIKMLHQDKQSFLKLHNVDNPRFHQEEPTMKIPSFIYNYRDPISAISLDGINFLKQFIANFMTTNNNLCTASKKSIQMFLYRNMRNISNETLLNDIEFLEHRGILTSRLAIFIYKICTFDYNASDKIIGLYFSKYYGRGKVINGKDFGVVNVKGYIVKNINFQELKIRNEIANKLYELGVHSNIIEQATGVSNIER
jgi:hypothetical protein